MAADAELVMDQAIAWHLGLEEAGAGAWRDFVAWLEADPAHAEAYDLVTLDDDLLEAPADRDVWAPLAPQRRRLWPQRVMWGGSALAAAAAAMLALLPGTTAHGGLYSIETRPGAHRDVTLADGTRIALNGGTRLTLDRADPRRATLDRGEAMFDVVHHADRPFELRVGGAVLQDVGTRFDVARRPGELQVAVAEGSVLYQPKADAVSLTRGMALAMRDGEDHLTLTHVDAGAVGGWQRGQLDFRGVPLGTVAQDVARSTGATIRIADALSARAFTGTLRVDRTEGEVVRNLAAMAGGSSRRDGPGWVIEPISAGGQ